MGGSASQSRGASYGKFWTDLPGAKWVPGEQGMLGPRTSEEVVLLRTKGWWANVERRSFGVQAALLGEYYASQEVWVGRCAYSSQQSAAEEELGTVGKEERIDSFLQGLPHRDPHPLDTSALLGLPQQGGQHGSKFITDISTR